MHVIDGWHILQHNLQLLTSEDTFLLCSVTMVYLRTHRRPVVVSIAKSEFLDVLKDGIERQVLADFV